MYGPAGAAKTIKTELAARFPGARFKVRTKRFAGGNSVDVYCPEGFAHDIRGLDREFQRFAYGRFDASTDSASSEHDPALPQAKYVSVSAFNPHVK